MLNNLDSFHSLTKTIIQLLVSADCVFCKQLDILDYIIEWLEKNKFFCNNIKNISNNRHYYKDLAY